MSNDNYYTYQDGDAERFARSVNARFKRIGSEISFKHCPYCKGGANRDMNTFSINTSTGQFECKRSSCSARGNMITLAKDYSDVFDLGKDVSAYYNIGGFNERSYRKFKDAKRMTESSPAAITYLKNRGIPEEVIKKYEITTKKDDDSVLVFPFKDEDGSLQFIKYRNTDPEKTTKGKEWCEKSCKPILFGMNHCTDFGTLVITEGQIDSLSVASAGIPNAVSVPTGKNGFTWKPHVWNWLLKFDEIVVFGDNENGNITLAKEITQFFPKRVRVVRPEDYNGYKDANDILQNIGAGKIVEAVNNARVQISMMIKPLSEVESVDLSKMEKLETGFSKIDDAIGGGFHPGDVIVLTGKCGEGKSTFASMILAHACKQNWVSFAYSGELPDFVFKAWLDSQIIGTTNMNAAQIETVNDWYRDKIYIYDNSAIETSEKEETDVFNVMADAVKNVGCRFIIIDNLMTAMEDKPQEDLFRQQSSFVGKLAKFARSYNVIILLVAHPKKGADKSNDSISGSGDITNKANLVLRYERGTEDDEIGYSVIKITKNRTTGILLESDEDKIIASYQKESRRVIQAGTREDIKFINWKSEADSFESLDDDMEDIPF